MGTENLPAALTSEMLDKTHTHKTNWTFYKHINPPKLELCDMYS